MLINKFVRNLSLKKCLYRLFSLLNFAGAAILNNCDVLRLFYCSDTKSFYLITKGQPLHVTIIQDGDARKI